MFRWAAIFLVVALIAGLFAITNVGVAGLATQIAWILFVIGIVLFLVFFILEGLSSSP